MGPSIAQVPTYLGAKRTRERTMAFRITMQGEAGPLEAVCLGPMTEAIAVAIEVVARGECRSAQVWDVDGTLLHEEGEMPETSDPARSVR